MTRLLTSLFLVTVVVLPTSAAFAGEQSTDSLRLGQRIRVDYDTTLSEKILFLTICRHTELTHASGRLLAGSDDLLILETDHPESDTITFPREQVRRLHVNMGKRRPIADATLIGALFGFTFWGLSFLGDPATEYDDEGNIIVRQDDRGGSAWALIGGGALIGAMIGSFMKVDVWREVEKEDWPVQQGVNRTSVTSGLRVGVTF